MRWSAMFVFVLCLLLSACGSGEQRSGEPGASSSSDSPPSGSSNTPPSDEVVQTFRDQGLEVGDSYPIEEDPGHAKFIGPKTYQEGTRFLLPSAGEDTGGQVYTYASRDDLEVMKNYWESLNEDTSGMLYSHVYDKGTVLVHITGQFPKGKADRYGQVLQEMDF